MIATCSKCHGKNRIPSGHGRVRCGTCKVELSIADLSHAVNEPPPVREIPLGGDDDLEDDEDF